MKGEEQKLVKVVAIGTILCVTSTLLQLLQFAIIANNFRKLFFWGFYNLQLDLNLNFVLMLEVSSVMCSYVFQIKI
jgi:hypothetical protein